MRWHEVRACPNCGRPMRIVDGSERTCRGRTFFTLMCDGCCHREVDWWDVPPNRKYRT